MNLKSQTAEHKGLLPELETDPETGLPKLPEGFAWKVEESYGNKIEVRIAVRVIKKTNIFEKIFLGDRDKESWNVYDHNFESGYDVCENNEEALKKCTELFYEEVRENHNKKVNGKNLTGLYPPKSIL
jgi:hypothetical protein